MDPDKQRKLQEAGWVVSGDVETFLHTFPTLLVAGFPGVGKSTLAKDPVFYNKVILDLDSSRHDKAAFPHNYIQHMVDLIGSAHYLLISSHLTVRSELEAQSILYHLVYPNINLKAEYLERYSARGSSPQFLQLLDTNWETWIQQIIADPNPLKTELQAGQFLSDVLLSL